MSDKDKTAFVASKELSEKIKKLQNALKLESPGEVISLALSMLEMAQGREVQFQDRKSSFRVSKFSKHNQTIVIEDGNGTGK